MNRRQRLLAAPLGTIVGTTLIWLLILGLGTAQNPSAPPEGYESVSNLLPLPDFIPGVGALYIDPSDAPLGPYLAYGHDGELVEVLYMLPLSEMNAAASWNDLNAHVLEQLGDPDIDHIDVTFNGGHPGMAEPHYHVRLVLVEPDTQQASLGQP